MSNEYSPPNTCRPYSPSVEDRESAGGNAAFDRSEARSVSQGASYSQRPILRDEAYYGVAGDLVREVSPLTEADPAALLIQFLAGIGTVFGRGPHFVVSSTRHGCNLFACVVAPTGDGKGLGMDIVTHVLTLADASFRERILTSFPSGESIPWNVRGDMVKRERNRSPKQGEPEFFEHVEPGVSDHRLLIRYSEFAECLQAMKKQDNTLSQVLRNAFDGSDLSTNGKTSACRADIHHIGFLAGITKTECKELMTTSLLSNGFVNRYIWIVSKSTRDIANPPPLTVPDSILERIRDAVAFAEKERVMEFDEQAERAYQVVYPVLKNRPENYVGQATSRARVQVRRMAMVFAVLDCSFAIRIEHLRAALAVWQFAEESASYLFGSSIRDEDSALLGFIHDKGGKVTRTEVYVEHFQKNKASRYLDEARDRLKKTGSIDVSDERPGDGKSGRATEVWVATDRDRYVNPLVRREGDYIAMLEQSSQTPDVYTDLRSKSVVDEAPEESVEPLNLKEGEVFL